MVLEASIKTGGIAEAFFPVRAVAIEVLAKPTIVAWGSYVLSESEDIDLK
jgi:hypothetical protein